jgi:hypothetical protein
MSENRMVRRTFGPKGDEVTGIWRKFYNESFIICTLLQILLQLSDQKVFDGHGS